METSVQKYTEPEACSRHVLVVVNETLKQDPRKYCRITQRVVQVLRLRRDMLQRPAADRLLKSGLMSDPGYGDLCTKYTEPEACSRMCLSLK